MEEETEGEGRRKRRERGIKAIRLKKRGVSRRELDRDKGQGNWGEETEESTGVRRGSKGRRKSREYTGQETSVE